MTFTSSVSRRRPGADRLTHALSLARDKAFDELPNDLRDTASAFAVEVRNDGLPPERLVVALKKVFEGLDHRTPMLSDPMMLEHEADALPLYAEWYASLLTVCIEAYFGAGE